MPLVKANAQSLRGLKCPTNKAYEDFPIEGAPGLSIRVSKTGSKTWRAQYGLFGKRRILTLGEFGELPGQLSLVEARARCSEVRSLAKVGIDPRAKQDAALEERRTRSERTVARLFEARVTDLRHRGRSESYIRNMINSFERNIIPALGQKPISEVTREDLEVPLMRLASEGKKRTYNDLLTIWQGLTNFAEVENPARKIRALRIPSRQIKMSVSDIRKVLSITGGPDDPFRSVGAMAVDLAVCTLVRSGACSQADINDFDLEAGTWTVPGDVEKTGLPFTLSLNTRAMMVVNAALKKRAGLRELPQSNTYLFPHRDNPDGHIRQDSLLQTWRRANEAAGLGGTRATLHDVRRSAVTHLVMIGHSSRITDKILQHRTGAAESRVATIYLGHDFFKERKEVLDDWVKRAF